MKITKKELFSRGFKPRSWGDKGSNSTEYRLHIKNRTIYVSGDFKTVELQPCNVISYYVEVPNCKTLGQLDNLIELFKVN